ncbi:MAG TPA: hypothetical protein VGC37_14800, partial [Friedmanniella sp.]
TGGRPGVGAGRPEAGLSADLLADLSDWRINLHARSFTAVSVEMLLRDLRRSVPSSLGYTLALVAVPGLPEVSITVTDGPLAPGRVLSTVRFGLPVSVGVTAEVTFYASEAYAFDRLATMIDDSAIFDSGRVELGGALGVEVQPGIHGLADHTKVNYAVGVLLARGRTFEEAERHLALLAVRLGSLVAAADHLLTAFDA